MELYDEQQALVVERLRAANGAPVSYGELREIGVENPALLGYELAAVGIPVQRQRTLSGAGALTLPVRPADTGGPAQLLSGKRHDGDRPAARDRVPATQGWTSPGVTGRDRGERGQRAISLPSSPGILAGWLLLAVLVAVAAMALAFNDEPAKTAAGVSSGPLRGRASPQREQAPTPTARRGRAPDRATRTRPGGHDLASTRAAGSGPGAAKPKPAIAVSVAAAAAFEAEGHQLLLAGRYGMAIGELRKAIEASGGSLARCSQPTTEACLSYAYALYDLGRALQLDGDPGAAVAVLSERLRIDNQRGVVEQELEVARRASSA